MKCKKNIVIFSKGKKCIFFIRKTCHCNIYPLIPHFYIVELGNAGVCFLLNFDLKHRLCVLVRTASPMQI